MAEAVEVAIQYALMDKLVAFGTTNSLTISWPNTTFAPPVSTPSAKWLRANILPADTVSLGVNYTSANQHYGLFQVDVFCGQGSGELSPARTASLLVAHYVRGTRLSKDGFTVEVTDVPKLGPLLIDGPWVMLPVRIPYTCFASNP